MYKMVLRHDVGSPAPDFTLKDASGREVSPSGYKGKSNVVLIFFIGGFDLHSMRNLRALIDNYRQIRENDAEVIAITPELPGKVETIVENLKPPFVIISDPELSVAKEYDVYNPEEKWVWPAAYIIDKDGVIQYAYRGASAPNTPPVEYIEMKLLQMKAGKAPAAPGPARPRT